MTGRCCHVLSIAGSDPSGGAGIQADLKTFSALGAYGMAAITAMTAQNTCGVTALFLPPPDFIAAEIDAIFSDIRVDAVKIGMLANAAIATKVAECLERWRPRYIVLDPVLAASSGDRLGTPDVVKAILERLAPLATLITPNLAEAACLAGAAEPVTPEEMLALGQTIRRKGARAVLVKGGHFSGDACVDYLVEAHRSQTFSAPRINTRNSHGTGCALSSAIAVYLAQGHSLPEAVSAAKSWLTGALEAADLLDIGQGSGPVHHFHALWK